MRRLVWFPALVLLIGCHSRQASAQQHQGRTLYRHGFISADTGCFDVQPAGRMSATDSQLVKRVGIVHADTELFGDYWPHARRLRPGTGLGRFYTLNAWIADSLTNSVRWRFETGYGGVAFEWRRIDSRYAGNAYKRWESPVDSLMGKVIAVRTTCPDTSR